MAVSNPRDLQLLLLGELLHVERRLQHEVLQNLAEAVHDDELAQTLRNHLEETRAHAERLETAFRRLDAAPSANLSRPFESAVEQHGELAGQMKEPRLADVFHAQAALHTEHWEIASDRAVLALVPDEVADLLRPSLAEEDRAGGQLTGVLERLAADARAR